MERDRRGWGFRDLFLTGAAAMMAGLFALAAATLWLQSSSQRFAERADMARQQAQLVARLETEAARAFGGADTASLDAVAKAYLDSIARETDLIDEDRESRDHQMREVQAAHRLLHLIRTGDMPQDLAAVRAQARAIAAREQQEAEEAVAAARAVQRTTWTWICAIMAALLALPVGFALLFWRHVVAPLDWLVRATDRLAAGEAPAALPEPGLREMRRLTGHFNDMALAVEQRVAIRTAALEVANRRLAETDDRRRLFLSKVSHELRTPVTVMRGEAEVALRIGGDAAALRESLHHVLDSSLFLQRRLDDLLALARAEDGALPLVRAPIDLADLARRAGETTAAFAAASGIRIDLAGLDGAMPVVGDADRLHQALVALIDNGVKFSPPGGTIHLRADSRQGYAGITVADQGPGVAQADLPRIFDPYVQGDAGRARGGTGLGLSLARWIVQAHDGIIAAHNRTKGDGLCVSLMLPVRA